LIALLVTANSWFHATLFIFGLRSSTQLEANMI